MMWLDRVISFFKGVPKCPVGVLDKLMLDKEFSILIEELGEEFILNSSVYSNPKEITGMEFGGDEAYAQILFQKLGDIIDVDVSMVEMGLFSEPADVVLDSGVIMVSDEGIEPASSKFTEYSDGSVEILINRGYLKDPGCLVASIAFELIRLKTKLKGFSDVYIEVALVFYGFGVFNANNSVIRMDTWSGDLRSGWNIKRGPSQLSPDAHGYLLAMYSCYRGENSPEWADSLVYEVAKAFYVGVKYLRSNSEGKE
jgi:hypothetical protein